MGAQAYPEYILDSEVSRAARMSATLVSGNMHDSFGQGACVQAIKQNTTLQSFTMNAFVIEDEDEVNEG